MANPVSVTWGYMATAEPMGQQRYENELHAALHQLADPDQFVFRSVPVRSLRGSIAGARRTPAGLLHELPYRSAAAIGRWTWRTRGLVHRFDTRLPPFPGREVLTVHDMAPFRFSDEGSPSRSWREGILRASSVITPSHFSAAEIAEHTGRGDITVAHNGISRGFLAHPAKLETDALQRLGLRAPFVLSAGGMTARKNMTSLAAAWSAVGPTLGMTLALAGPVDPRRDAMFAGMPGVVLLGKVPDSLLPSLFASASLYVSASTYEGFGLPCLEAMAVGTPVLAVRSGVAEEICGDGALLVGSSAEDLAEGLHTLVVADGQRQRLTMAGIERASRFTWEKSARIHLAAYQETVS